MLNVTGHNQPHKRECWSNECQRWMAIFTRNWSNNQMWFVYFLLINDGKLLCALFIQYMAVWRSWRRSTPGAVDTHNTDFPLNMHSFLLRYLSYYIRICSLSTMCICIGNRCVICIIRYISFVLYSVVAMTNGRQFGSIQYKIDWSD